MARYGESQSSESVLPVKAIWTIILVVACFVIGGIGYFSCVGRNDEQNWQIIQSLDGTITVRDTAGFYPRFFSSVWTYPRYLDFRYNDDPEDGDTEASAIRVTFNDGGTATIGAYIRIQTPVTSDDRKEFHRQFAGSRDSIRLATQAHLSNCLKVSAPLMSASENQSARKAEFSQIVELQLTNGLYEMKKVERELKDRYDENGKPITVFATEVIEDENGSPIVNQTSPLTKDYHMSVVQFSVTETDYDEEILRQFAAKKDSFLKAEQSKAQREQAVQERLKIQEEGLRNKAEAEAKANVEKAVAVIQAQQKAEVALQVKKEAETKASQLLEVAKVEKQQAETTANKELEVAKILAQAAEQKKLAIIAEAEGKQKAIELSGEITKLEQTIIDAEVMKAKVIAEGIARIQMPSFMSIGGAGGGTDSEDIMTNLINLKLLDSTGLLDRAKLGNSAISAKRVDKPQEQTQPTAPNK